MNKNINISRTLEKVANRQQHFSIRKLTIGATSVLLGTTLWLGNHANIVRADEQNNNGDASPHEATQLNEHTPQITANTKVEVQQSQASQNSQGANASKQSQPQTASEQNIANSKAKIVSNENNAKGQNVQTDAIQNGDKTNNQNDTANNVNNDRNSAGSNAIAQTVSKRAFKSNQSQVSAKQTIAQKSAEQNLAKQNLNISVLGNTGIKDTQKQDNSASLSLLLKDNKLENKLLSAQDKSAQSIKQVSDWNQLVSAANDQSINDIQITQNIDATANLQLNRSSALTIESVPASATVGGTAPITKYSLNMGSNAIDLPTSGQPSITLKNLTITGTNSQAAVQSNNANGSVHFENVEVNGTPLFNGKGTVYIDGQVSSNVSGIAHSSRNDITRQFSSLTTYGISDKNWYNANILADNVFIGSNAHLTIRRDLTGDGIILEGGLSDGTNQKRFGSVNVGDNAQLDIILKNGHDLAASTEQASSIDNANTAIFAPQNGQFKTGTDATVNIYAGHGRGIIFDEPVGGTSSIQEALMGDWARQRSSVSKEASAQNDFELGNFTKFNVHSRDGVLLGNNATLNTGEHSNLNFDNHGNGIGLQLDAQAKVEIAPYTDFEMHSDGKTSSGNDRAGNYIGLGDNAQFTVDHDATFRYKLNNTGSGKTYYTDAFNIVSADRNSKPTINVEKNAIFDGESDYKNFYGQILSFSMVTPGPIVNTVNINDARYFNLQRDAATDKGQGNVFYSGAPCTFNINGDSENPYNIYKWSNGNVSQDNFDSTTAQKLNQSIQNLNNSADEYWSNVKNVNINSNDSKNTFDGNSVGQKHQWNFNDQTNGFNFVNSQRLAIVGTKWPQGTVNVIFHDTTSNKDITGYGPKISLTGDEGTAVSGYNLDNQIKALENQGYIRDASANVPAGDLTQMPANYTDGSEIVYINMKHDIVPVNSSTPGKPGQAINVNDPNGPKFPADSGQMSTTVTRTINYIDQNGNPVNGSPDGKSSVTQTVTFIGSGYLDKVTGHWVSVDGSGNITGNADGPTWSESDSHNFAEIDSKATVTENGQTLNAQTAISTTPGQVTSDGKSAKAITVNHNTGNIAVTVTYGPESPISYQTEIKYEASLKPGQIELYQQGKNGIKDSTGETITAAQDEIIYVGSQTATINYLEKDGNNAPVAIKDASGNAIIGTATDSPIVANSNGSIEFDNNGNTTPNKINYNDGKVLSSDNADLQRAEEAAGSDYKYDINRDDWSQAVNLGTNVYDNQGLTRSAIVEAAEKLQEGQTAQLGVTNGPTYNVVLFKSEHVAQSVEQVSITQKIQRAIEYKNNKDRQNISDPNGADRNTAAGLDDMSKSLLHGEAKDEQSITLKGIAYLDTSTGKFVNVKTKDGHAVDADGNYIAVDDSGNAVVGDLQSDGTVKARLTDGKTTLTNYVVDGTGQGTFKWSLDTSDAAGFNSPTADHYSVNPGSVPALDGSIKTTATFVKDAQGNTVNNPTLKQVVDYLNNESAQEALQQAVSQDVITDAADYPQMPQVPSTQYIFDQFRLSNTSGNTDLNYVVTLAADRDDPTGAVHVYITNPDYSKTYASRTAEVNNSTDPVYFSSSVNGDQFKIKVYNWGGQNGDSVSVNVNGGFTLKRIFGYGAQSKDTSNSWGDFKPRQVIQTINYVDEKTGQEIQGYPSIRVTGLSGQRFNAGDVNKLIIWGYTFDQANSDIPSGTISDYQVGHTYTKTWNTSSNGHTYKVTEQHKLINSDGTMQTVVYVNGLRYEGTIAPGGYMTAGSFQIQNPWVKPTADVSLRYKEAPVTIDQNQAVNYVVYTPNAKGTVNVIFHDTTTNTGITGYGPKTALTGDEGTDVTGYTPDADISTLEGLGYVRDTTTPIPTGDLTSMPAKYTDGNQTVYINIKHKLDKIDSHNPHGQTVTATVTRRVNYTVDGVPDSSLPSHTETVTFNATGYYDEVTNKVVDQNGNESQLTWTYSLNGGTAQNGDSTTFTGYAVPTKQGYHVNSVTVDPTADKDANADDTGLVKDLSVNTKSHNVTISINLTKNAPAANVADIVNYIDDTTGQTLRTDNGNVINTLTGKPNDQVTYTTADIIQGYEGQGYRLVSNDFHDGQESFGNTGHTYNVHLAHQEVVINKNNPGQPGQPINSSDPNGPKWSDDTDENQLEIRGSQTIHYTGAGSHTPADNVQNIEFDHEIVIDKVTGKQIADHGWTVVDPNTGNVIGNGNNYKFAAETTPVLKGYHADEASAGGVAVTSDNPNITLTVHYIRNTGTVTVTFRDDTLDVNIPDVGYNSGSQDEGTQIFYNPSTDQSKLENQGYVYARTDGTLPAEVPEGTTNVIIHMTHGTTDVSTTDPQAQKTIKRTIIVTNPNGSRSDLSQTLQLHRSAVQDQVTKQVTYGNWNTSHFDAVTIPSIAGYTASQTSIPAVQNVSANYTDPEIQVVYTRNGSNQGTAVIDYIDPAGEQVGNQVISGTIGQAITVDPNVPDGYDLKNPLGQVTINGHSAATIRVPVVDHLITYNADQVPADKPVLGIGKHSKQSATILPGTKGKYSHDDLTYADLHRERTRSIVIINPDDSLNKKSIIQTVDFIRSATIDAITGKITFSAWQPAGEDSFDELDVPAVAGYTPTQTRIDRMNNVASDYVDRPIVIRYQGNPTTETITYRDNQGNVIGTQALNGRIGQTLPLKLSVPDGYELISSQNVPKQISLGLKKQDLSFEVKPITVNIDPDQVTVNKPISSHDVIAGTKTKHLVHDLTYEDLHKDVTRTITIKQPDGATSPSSCTQTVHFTRTASIDAATGNVTYSKWIPEGNDSLASVSVPSVPGYTAITQVPAVSQVDTGYVDPQIVVIYTPNEQKQTVVYRDEDGHILGQQVITGKTDQTVKTNLQAPDGYVVDENSKAPSQVKISATPAPITVTVAPKQTVIKADDVTPDKPVSKDTVIPGTVNKHADQDISYNDLHKDVQRQVIITLPNGQSKTTVQTVHFERDTQIDTATGKVSFGNWTTKGTDNFAKVDLLTISGYIPTGTASEVDGISNSDQSQTVKINYLPDTPANRLQVAKNTLDSLQKAQQDFASKMNALQNTAAQAGQASQVAQSAYQKQQTLVKNLAQKSSDLQKLVSSLNTADQLAKQKAEEAQKKVNDLKNKLADLNNQKQAEQTKLAQEKNGLQAQQNRASQLRNSLANIQNNIDAVKKAMAHAQEILDMQKDYAHATLDLSSDYIQAIKNYEKECDNLFEKIYQQNVASRGNHDARAIAFNTIDSNNETMRGFQDTFYKDINQAGQKMINSLSKIYDYHIGSVWNKDDAQEKVDLNHITDQQEKEIDDYTFALLNNIREQLGMKPFLHSQTTDDFAKKVAEQYLSDGRSIFNMDAHDAWAVNDWAQKFGLQSIPVKKGEVSHNQKYENIASWYADANLVILPNKKGQICVMLFPGNENDYHSNETAIKTGQTNMDSIKQGIFANVLQMLLTDSHSSWGHTASLLNLGAMKDYMSANPEYFLGTSISRLGDTPPESGKVIDEGGYTNHFLNVARSDIEAGNSIKADNDITPIHVPTAAEVAAAEQELKNGEAQLSQYEKQQDEEQKELAQVNADISDRQNIVNATQSQLNSLDQQINQFNSELRTAEGIKDGADQDKAKNDSDLQQQKDALQKTNEDAQKGQTILDGLKTKADDAADNAQAAQNELNKFKNRSGKISSQIGTIKEAIDIHQPTTSGQGQQNNQSGQTSDNQQGTTNSGSSAASANDSQSTNNSQQGSNTSASSLPDLSSDVEDSDEPDEPGNQGTGDDSDSSSQDENGDEGAGDSSSISRSLGHENSSNVYQRSDVKAESAAQMTSGKSYMPLSSSNHLNDSQQQNALPKTGADSDTLADIAGAAAVSLALIGLAGVRKKRRKQFTGRIDEF